MGKFDWNYLLTLLLLLATSAVADDQIPIKTSSTTSLSGPFSCPKQNSSPTINVRIQSIQTSSGLIFHRKTIAEDLFVCFEAAGNKILAVANIKLCAEATGAAGLQMFRWTDGTCTGYVQGIPMKMYCNASEAVVLYSVDAVPSTAANSLLLHHSVSSIYAKWAPCHPDFPAKPVTKFKLTWNGTTIELNGTTYEHRFKNLGLCNSDLSGVDRGLKNVTLAAYDNTDTLVMKPVTKTVTTNAAAAGRRIALKSKNCLFFIAGNTSTTHDYSEEVDFCGYDLFGTLFNAYADGDLTTYMDDLATLKAADPSASNTFQYVDLKCVEGATYKWLSGREEDIEDLIWDTASSSSQCCATTSLGGGPQLSTASCTANAVSRVCHEFVA